MGIKAAVRQRLAVSIAGALLVGSLVAGIAPVAADGGADNQDGRIQNQSEDRDVAATDTHLSITSVTVAPVASLDIPVMAPLDNEARFIEGKDDGE